MIDFANATPEQIEQLCTLLEKTQQNPIEILKMETIAVVYDLLDWCEKRISRDQLEFERRKAGLEAQIVQLFTQTQNDIANKTNVPCV